jgi:3-hydroxybutyryl-CoA dehydrogenase
MIDTVGVIGSGQMGSGIAQVLAQAGCTVRLLDVNDAQLQKGLATVTKGFERLVAKG